MESIHSINEYGLSDGRVSIGLTVSGAWSWHYLPLITSCLLFLCPALSPWPHFTWPRNSSFYFISFCWVFTHIGFLMQKGELATVCDRDSLAIVHRLVLDSVWVNHFLSPRNLDLEFRDLYRVIFACVFTCEIIIPEVRSHCLLYHAGSVALKRGWRRRWGEREREKQREIVRSNKKCLKCYILGSFIVSFARSNLFLGTRYILGQQGGLNEAGQGNHSLLRPLFF